MWVAILVAPGVFGQTVETKLTAFDAASNDKFGVKVDLDGDTLVVGASTDDTPTGLDAGSVHVFIRDGGGWSFQQQLFPDDPIANHRFGSAVGVSGDLIAVGARGDSDQGAFSGAAYIFRRVGTIWSQHDKLFANLGADAGDEFGFAIAIDTDDPQEVPGEGLITTVVVGAPRDDAEMPFCCRGSIYVFTLSADGTDWNIGPRFIASDSDDNARFGASIAIAGDGMMVGSPDWDTGSPVEVFGHAYFFQRRGITATWGENFIFEASDAGHVDSFGESVTVVTEDGDYYAIVGASGSDDDVLGDNIGAAYSYHGNTNLWVEQKITSVQPAATVSFGIAVAANSDILAIGESRLDINVVNSGGLQIFRLNNAQQWVYDHRQLASDQDLSENLAASLAVSNLTVLAGAPGESRPPGVGQGAAYVFEEPIFADGFESGDTSAWSSTQ